MGDVKSIFSGPAEFVWGVTAAGVEEAGAIVVDMTQGGIRFWTETTYHEPVVDQTGTAPVKSVKTGTIGKLEFITPDMGFDKAAAFNPADVIKVISGTGANQKVKFQVSGLAGSELPRKRAVIKPLGVTDKNRFIYLEECSIKFDLDASFKLDDNLKMPINGLAHPSLPATPKGLIYTWGDISATGS